MPVRGAFFDNAEWMLYAVEATWDYNESGKINETNQGVSSKSREHDTRLETAVVFAPLE